MVTEQERQQAHHLVSSIQDLCRRVSAAAAEDDDTTWREVLAAGMPKVIDEIATHHGLLRRMPKWNGPGRALVAEIIRMALMAWPDGPQGFCGPLWTDILPPDLLADIGVEIAPRVVH